VLAFQKKLETSSQNSVKSLHNLFLDELIIEFHFISVAVCAVVGYSDFLRPVWLRTLLLWLQKLSRRSACFEYYRDKRMRSSWRRKRADATIEVGQTQCSVHFSAVGIMALSMHLRYMLERCVPAGPGRSLNETEFGY